MKAVKYLVAIVAGVFFLIACQKELSVESGLTGGLATGTLKDSLGACMPVSVNGRYFADSTLKDSNFVYITITVATPGVYRIGTDIQNGFSFRDSGYFSTAGPQIIKLKGTGRPILSIPTTFTVSFGTSQCFFIVPVTTASGGGTGTTAAFSFDNSTGVCASPVFQGTYAAGTPLTAANTVRLNITVTTPGTYSITTPLNNGFRFSGTGTLTTAGPATILLTGTGTPTAGGSTAFIINNATSGCGFSVTVTSSTPSATYSLVGSPGNCTGGTVQGTYTAGTALTAANTITVSVNVTVAGAYNISTAPLNGMTFSKAGTFATTGVQSVVLQGTGTPTTSGTTTVPVLAPTSGCGLAITVGGTGGTPTAADSAWSFNQGTRFFYGPIDSAVYSQPDSLLSIAGKPYGASDTALFIDVFFSTGIITPGTYSTATTAAFNFSSFTGDIYTSDPTTTGAVMSIVITSYNPITRIVVGTYSGNAETSSGSIVPITNGKFRAMVR